MSVTYNDPEERQGSTFDSKDFRRALGTFASGVTVVTTLEDDGTPRGFTANSFTSVSLEPPLVLVCLAKTASCYPVFSKAARFAVNILAEDQKEISTRFTSKVADRFSTVGWHREKTGAPIIEAVAAWMDCRMHDTVDAGDHIILIGHVDAYSYTSARPLGYFRGLYFSFSTMEEAIEEAIVAVQDAWVLQFGAIVEHNRMLLLDGSNGDGELSVPTASKFGGANRETGLEGKLGSRGIDVNLAFPFATVEDAEKSTHTIYYSGEARRVAANEINNFMPFDKIPWSRISNGKLRDMLQRYVFEREQNDIII